MIDNRKGRAQEWARSIEPATTAGFRAIGYFLENSLKEALPVIDCVADAQRFS